MDELVIIGRSSSLFTRVARIFAGELGVSYALTVVADLGSRNRDDYAGNPALKIPTLQIGGEQVFGTLNICRVLADVRATDRHAGFQPPVWPEDLDRPILRNAHELTLQAMTTEISIIMAQHGGVAGDNPHVLKMRESLTGTLAWLEECVRAQLPNLGSGERLSFFEVCLFCLICHLEFRKILDVSGYASLGAFRDRFGQRPSARDTPFKFDATSAHR